MDTRPLGPCCGFKLLGADARQMLMASGSIVEALDVVGDFIGRLLARVVDAFLDALYFQAQEEGLCDGVVPAVAPSAHARLQAVCSAESEPVIAAVLGPLI